MLRNAFSVFPFIIHFTGKVLLLNEPDKSTYLFVSNENKTKRKIQNKKIVIKIKDFKFKM